MAYNNKFFVPTLILAVLVAGCSVIGTAEKAPAPAVAASAPRPPVAIMMPEVVNPLRPTMSPSSWLTVTEQLRRLRPWFALRRYHLHGTQWWCRGHLLKVP